MNNGKASIKLDNERLLVSGDMNYITVVGLWDESLPLLARVKQLILDLSAVTTVNSAALALMLEWLKYAKREGKSILFQNLPTQLKSIAVVAGIDNLLIAHS